MMKPRIIRDEYRVKARLQPAFLFALPLGLALGLLAALSMGDVANIWRLATGAFATLATGVGLGTYVEQHVRERGKDREPGLWKSWDGAPTTRMLRHRETELSTPVQRVLLHQKLKKLVPKLPIPTAAQEKNDPTAADQVYEEAVRHLRSATRDEVKFRHIFRENMNYGFCRNLWAMRRGGIVLTCFALALTLCLTTGALVLEDRLWLIGLLVILTQLLFLWWWIVRVTPAWVFVPARAYAERLFEACDTLLRK